MRLIKIFVLLSVLSLIIETGFTQKINLHSISAIRQNGGDNGYSLDGQRMVSSRLKLLNTNNFGSNGTYSKEIDITDGYYNANSLSSINNIQGIDIFFFGTFAKNDASFIPITIAEIDSLYKWSKNGGKLIICNQPAIQGSFFSILNSHWGYDIYYDIPCNFIPTTQGNASDIFNGPFGAISTANQGGSAQGLLTNIPTDVIILAKNATGQPTLYLDCNTLDLIIADVDAYTDLGGISSGANITNNQDKFWANTIAYMDKMESPPVISINENNLITNNYANYQWYFNGSPITKADSSTYHAYQNGEYTVQITYFNGCKTISNTVIITNIKENILFIPNIFSPNGDNKNDTLYVRGNGIIELNFMVYDRWGEKVFETNDIKNGWDGTYNGNSLNATVFVYYAKAVFENGETIEKNGNFTLVK